MSKKKSRFDMCIFILRNYKQLEHEMNTDIYSAARGGDDPTYHAAVNNRPTYLKGIRIHNADKWVQVAKATVEHFKGRGEGELIQLHYEQRMRYNTVMAQLHITKSCFYTWRQNIRNFFNMAACQAGLKKVF